MDVTDAVLRIRRAFDAAFLRLCEAKNPQIAEDELSNLLSQIYRLRELVRKELGDTPFRAAMSVTPERQAAGGAVWVRTFDTHDAVVVGKMGDIYTDYYAQGSPETVRRDPAVIEAYLGRRRAVKDLA